MAELEIELSKETIEGVRRLAVCHYGDSGDASVGRVVEAALEMRLFWLDLVKEGGNEIDEPLLAWESANKASEGPLPAGIQDWLFKRR